ncbi:hypothetical protein CRG98_019243 [Punica granatum]|nr:hypothetical protein CRG98_019243 [Punica granatum]
MQHLMGIDGVIVDLVREITEAVANLIKPPAATEETLSETIASDDGAAKEPKPHFSERELSFLLKLIPELIQL